jgi:hypothetical protein
MKGGDTMNKTKLLAFTGSVVAGATLLTTTAFAQTPQDTNSDTGMKRFKWVGGEMTDEQKAQIREEMQAKSEERLNKAVSDGVITQAQKEALVAKQSEMQQAQEKLRTDFESWAESQGIDLSKLFPKREMHLRMNH